VPVSNDAYGDALARRLLRRSVVSGQIRLPAVPSMVEHHVASCARTFAAVGRAFTDDELDQLRTAIRGEVQEAFAASPRSSVVITYEATAGSVITYLVRAEWSSLEDAYDQWVSTREPPLFGTEPDARVWALANEAVTDPQRLPVLDVGGGTGRNGLALARRGHPVDIVEMAPEFASILREAASAEQLDVRVIQRDVLAATGELRRGYGIIVVSEVVSDFRSTDELRALFELAAHHLAPGGRLVLNAFLATGDYRPDAAARELGQQVYTAMFTREELAGALAGLPLRLLTDDAAIAYEQAHLPEGAWPPTSWYVGWASGNDLFDLPGDDCPIELRWLVYEKPSDPRFPTHPGP
jgi:SAM-dependent methyltransferase